MKVQKCKGTQDFSPEEMKKFRRIESIFRDCCLKWGYGEVRTPTLEYLHLFTAAGTLTPGRLGRVYSFLDWDGWSGERVVMRPDGTIPIARMYIDDLAGTDPAKLFYVTNVFIFEETGKETREKWQCGAELIGPGSTAADIETILLPLEILKKLGLRNVELVLSHAALIKALLARFDLSPGEQARVFDRLLDGDETALAEIDAAHPKLGKTLAPLLELKGTSSGYLKNLRAHFNQEFPELKPALDGFIALTDLLEETGVKYQIDIASGRGFEYYTGVMFKLLVNGRQVGGGGRYDDLIPLIGGESTPASGFALYLDVLMDMVKPAEIAGRLVQKVLIKAGKRLKEGFDLADELHKAGFAAEIYLGGPEPSDHKWLVSLAGDAFDVADNSGGGHHHADGREDLLALLKG